MPLSKLNWHMPSIKLASFDVMLNLPIPTSPSLSTVLSDPNLELIIMTMENSLSTPRRLG
jgi:hypothetical protein